MQGLLAVCTNNFLRISREQESLPCHGLDRCFALQPLLELLERQDFPLGIVDFFDVHRRMHVRCIPLVGL